LNSKGAPTHRARKRFGQNFLHDSNVIHNIINSIGVAPGQNVVEIGPGMGALTEQLLQKTAGNLTAIELDRDLVSLLQTRFSDYPDFKIDQADALKFDFSQIATENEPLRIVGNLPYNISTPLIFRLLSFAPLIKDMHFMLQKEVVDRLSAAAGNRNYGRLSVMAQYHCQIIALFDVPPQAFRPQPKVDSAIVRLIPYEKPPFLARDHRCLADLVRTAFNQRRKTLRNNLKGLITDQQLLSIDINPSVRAETLTPADFVRISNLLS